MDREGFVGALVRGVGVRRADDVGVERHVDSSMKVRKKVARLASLLGERWIVRSELSLFAGEDLERVRNPSVESALKCG